MFFLRLSVQTADGLSFSLRGCYWIITAKMCWRVFSLLMVNVIVLRCEHDDVWWALMLLRTSSGCQGWFQVSSDWLVVRWDLLKRSGAVQSVRMNVGPGFCGSDHLNPLGWFTSRAGSDSTLRSSGLVWGWKEWKHSWTSCQRFCNSSSGFL